MGPRVIFSAGFWDAVPSGLGLGETDLAWVKKQSWRCMQDTPLWRSARKTQPRALHWQIGQSIMMPRFKRAVQNDGQNRGQWAKQPTFL